MKILVAGATGAIGQPLIDLLIHDGHDVYGITQSEDRARAIAAKGAKSVILNVLDRDAVFASIEKLQPDIVVDMLTHLPKTYTAESMREAAPMDAKIRLEGGGNLLAAAEKCSCKRYIAQSSGFWYEPGVGLADENTPFAFNASPGVAAGVKIYAEIEQRVLQSTKIEGVALRFGFFYGPGTWFHPDGDVAAQIRQRKLPIIGHGDGVWNFVYINDAAKAIAAAVYSYPGAYNVVNDRPSAMREWLPAFARFLGAPSPPWLTEEEGLKQRGEDAVYYATKLRGASNEKAKRLFNFQPQSFEWFM